MASTYTDRIQGTASSTALKAPVRVATTGNITLSGLQTVNGVSVVADDRVLVKNQTSAAENGIWIASAGAWTRALDFNGARDVVQGTRIYVTSGTVNAQSTWMLTTADPVVGTSSLAFATTVSEPFMSRTLAQSAETAVGATAISVLHAGVLCDYVYDATGTALTTGDLRTWSPAGDAYPEHWGGNSDGADTIAGWLVNRRAWATATAYAVGDLLWVSKVGYRCIVAHTSAAAFATDLAAAKWVQGAFSGTDNTAAFLAALTWLSPNKRSLKLLSGGKYRFAHQGVPNAGYISLAGLEYVSIVADGEADLLIDEDTAYWNGGVTSGYLFDTGASVSQDRYEHDTVEFRNVRFRGRWSHANAKTGVNGVRVEGYRKVLFEGGGATDIRQKTTRCRTNGSFKVINTRSERCARGFWRSQDTDNFFVCDNFMQDGDDDAIDWHSYDENVTMPARSIVTVRDNTLINCEGILGLGAKVATVTGNKLRLCHGTNIAVGSGVDPEGNTAAISITVANNLVLDPLERADAGVFEASNVNQGAIYVAGGKKSSASTGGTVPGDYSAADLAFFRPYIAGGTSQTWGAMWHSDTIDEGGDATVYSSPGGKGFVVDANQVMRTLPALGAFSDAGIGYYFHGEEGYLDPALATAAYKANAIIMLGDMTDFVVQDNVLSGLSNAGIWFRGAAGTDQKTAFRNGKVTGNVISDVLYGIGKDDTGSPPAFADYADWTIDFADNRIDLDPYHKAPIRTSPLDGTWQSSADLSYSGILWRNGKGASFVNNDFKNCYQPIQGNSEEAEQFVMRGNVIRCNPAAVTWNAANIGVAVPGHGGGAYVHLIEDGDPRNATYGKTLNACPTDAGAVPTSGKFVTGHFVKRRNPTTVDSATIFGWVRQTVGSGHTVATTGTADWAPITVAPPSPALALGEEPTLQEWSSDPATNATRATANAAAINAAWTAAAAASSYKGKVVRIKGHRIIPINARLIPPAAGNFFHLQEKSAILAPIYNDTGGFIRPATIGTAIPKVVFENITIEAAIDSGTGKPFIGNHIVGLYDDSLFVDFDAKRFQGDQGFLVGGSRSRWINPHGFCDDTVTGTGLFRFVGGSDTVITNLTGQAPDDGAQFVPLNSGGAGWANLAINRCSYIGGNVYSTLARAIAVLTDTAVTSDIVDCRIEGMTGRGSSRQIIMRGLNGAIRNVTVNASLNASTDAAGSGNHQAIYVQGDVRHSKITGTISNVQRQLFNQSDYAALSPTGNTVDLESPQTPAFNYLADAVTTYPMIQIDSGTQTTVRAALRCNANDSGIKVDGGVGTRIVHSDIRDIPNGKWGVNFNAGADVRVIESRMYATGTGEAIRVGTGLAAQFSHKGTTLNGVNPLVLLDDKMVTVTAPAVLSGLPADYSTSSLDIVADYQMQWAQTAAVMGPAKRTLLAQHGAHATEAEATLHIKTQALGSTKNGPSFADYGQVISIHKKNFAGALPTGGEIDGLKITVLQDGPQGLASGAAGSSDAAGILVGIQNVGDAGFIAGIEMATTNLDDTTLAVSRQIQTQIGVMTMNGAPAVTYGYVTVAKAGVNDHAFYAGSSGGTWINLFFAPSKLKINTLGDYAALTADWVSGAWGISRAAGVNGLTTINARGTGGLLISTTEAGPISFATSAFTRMTIPANGTGLTLFSQATEDQVINVGQNRTGDGNSFISLFSDTTYTTYGARLIKFAGANGALSLQTRGTGGINVQTVEAGPIRFLTTSIDRGGFTSGGDFQVTALVPNKISYRTGVGVGGAVTQATSKATGVTLNTQTGQITTAADALAAGASVNFEVTNSVATSASMIDAVLATTAVDYTVIVVSASAGRFSLRLTNISAGSLSQAVAINFEIRHIATT